jgi:hypothetical protein
VPVTEGQTRPKNKETQQTTRTRNVFENDKNKSAPFYIKKLAAEIIAPVSAYFEGKILV